MKTSSTGTPVRGNRGRARRRWPHPFAAPTRARAREPRRSRRPAASACAAMFAVGNPSRRPSFAPCADSAPDREAAAEQRRGAREIARRERRADGRRRRALAVDDRHGAHRLDAERPRCRAAQWRRSPARPLPKRKSSPTSTQRTPRRRTSTPSMNASGSSDAKPAVEARDVRVARRRARRTARSCRAREDNRGGALACGEELARRRIESQHGRWQRRDPPRPRRAGRASPGDRDGRRRNCRSSARPERRPLPEDREKPAPRSSLPQNYGF